MDQAFSGITFDRPSEKVKVLIKRVFLCLIYLIVLQVRFKSLQFFSLLALVINLYGSGVGQHSVVSFYFSFSVAVQSTVIYLKQP